MKIAFSLDGHGWARAVVTDHARSAELTASYLSDALGDLVEAVATLMDKGARESRCSWDEEPGEFRWIFTREDRRIAHLRILRFDELRGGEPDERGRLIFETRQPLQVLGSAVRDCALEVLDRYGEREYVEKWVEHPFPRGALQRLEERLNPIYPATRKRHGNR